MRRAVALWLAVVLLDRLADRSDAKKSQFRKQVRQHACIPPSALAALTSRRCLLPD
jgi:hypothetical protein